MKMNIQEIYEIYKQHPIVSTDSRNCPEGSIFFALKGASFNGNAYAASALEKGSAYAVVDEEQYAADARCILVDDVLQTLQQLAAYHRQQLRIPVLQVTGTNGKTTTKELVSAVLSRRFRTLYTQGNLNNHIGVPLTLLRIRPEHEIAVVETGANHPGEIDFLCRMVKADAGLISNVGRAHLEGFGSFEGVKRTKGELYDDLAMRGKTILLNAFDDDLRAMAEGRASKYDFEMVPYPEGRVEECNPFVKVQWREDDDKPWHSIQTQLIGAYNIANIRAAVAVGLYYGVEPEEIDVALSEYHPTNNRSEFRKTERNSLIVDAYNANPSSMAAALTNFAFIGAERKMVILGDMRELGTESLQEHEKVVFKLQEQKDIQTIWLVGEEFRKAAQEAPFSAAEGCEVAFFSNVEEVKEALVSHAPEGCTILIKGSNGTRLFQLPELL